MLLLVCRLENCLAAPLTALARHRSTHVGGEVALQLCQLADTLPPSLAAVRLIGCQHTCLCMLCSHVFPAICACTGQPALHCSCKQSAACCLMPQAMLIIPRACCAVPWHPHQVLAEESWLQTKKSRWLGHTFRMPNDRSFVCSSQGSLPPRLSSVQFLMMLQCVVVSLLH